MQRFYLFLAFSFGMTLISAVQSNNKTALEVCVNQYAAGFADPKYQKMDDIGLHCLLGKKLALCANTFLCKSSTSAFKALAKAALSYSVFEKSLEVCQSFCCNSLVKNSKLNSGDCEKDKLWRQRINRLLHPSKIPKCAAKLDKQCIIQFTQQMKTNANLCVNIPLKSKCLLEGNKTCQANILTDLLEVYPQEASKVLAVLCKKAQKSG